METPCGLGGLRGEADFRHEWHFVDYIDLEPVYIREHRTGYICQPPHDMINAQKHPS